MKYHVPRRRVLAWVLFSLLVCVPAVSRPAPVSSADAAAAARTFCLRLGVTAAGEPDVKYTIPADDSHYWKPQWQVKVPDGTEVDVACDSDLIVGYRAANPHPVASFDPAAKMISRDDALRFSTTALNATGIPLSELALTEVDPPQRCSEPSRGCLLYYIFRWDRLFDGVQFEDIGASTMLDAITGRVTQVSLLFHSPPPASMKVGVDPNTACITALGCMASHHNGDEVIVDGMLRIVRPNSFWTDGKSDPAWGLPRLAWEFQSQGDQYTNSTVWVDAGDGTVIGGEHGGAGCLPAPRPPGIPPRLRRALTIQVFARDRKFRWMSHPLGTLSRTRDGAILADLDAAPVVPNPGGDVVRFKLRLEPPDPADPRDVDYIPSARLIGLPGEWHAAPDGFVKWVAARAGNRAIMKP